MAYVRLPKDPRFELLGRTVYLHPISHNDLEAVKPLIVDQKPLTSGGLIVTPQTNLDVERWYKQIVSDPLSTTFTIWNRESQKYIGNTALIDLDLLHRCATTETIIDPSHRRKGYAVEAKKLIIDLAFDTLHLRRLNADVIGDNLPAIRLLRRCRYNFEGIRPLSVWTFDGWKDEILFGLSARDWDYA